MQASSSSVVVVDLVVVDLVVVDAVVVDAAVVDAVVVESVVSTRTGTRAVAVMITTRFGISVRVAVRLSLRQRARALRGSED